MHLTLRQAKPEEGGSERRKPFTETFHCEPAGVSPARRRRPPAGSESCVEAGQPVLRSVDSKRDGCVIEPRKAFVGEAERRCQSGGNIEALQWSCAEIPPGSKSDGKRAKGSLRNLGAPIVSVERSRMGHRRPKVLASKRWTSGLLEERNDGRHHGIAERRQRSEARRTMGSRSASKVPVKRGNGRGTPWREEKHRGTESPEGQATRTPIRVTVSTELRRIASRSQAVTRAAGCVNAHVRICGRPGCGNHPGPPGKHCRDLDRRGSFAADPRCWADLFVLYHVW